MDERLIGKYSDTSGEIAILGGYIDVQLDGDTICTVSIPKPNILAHRDSDSIVYWSEDFEDEEDNIYEIYVESSMVDTNWNMTITPNPLSTKSKDDILLDLSQRLTFDMNYTQEV